MKLISRITLRNSDHYNEVVSLSGNLLLLYRIEHAERLTHMCILNERSSKIIKKFTIPFTFTSIFVKRQTIFFVQQSILYKIDNLISNPSAKQIISIPSSANQSANPQQESFQLTEQLPPKIIREQVQFLPEAAILNSDTQSNSNECNRFSDASQRAMTMLVSQSQLLITQNRKYLITVFRNHSILYLLNSKGELSKRLQLGDNIKIDNLLPLENEQDKILLITSNKYFIIYDLKTETQTKKIKIPFQITEGSSDSIKISHVQKNEYLINSFENLQIIDFDQRRIKTKVRIDENSKQEQPSSCDDLYQSSKQNERNIETPSSPRMFVQNMIKINQSTFLGQYTLQYQGDSRLFFIDFSTKSLTTHYFDQNIKFIKLKRIQSKESSNTSNKLMMFNPSYQSKFLQLSFYSTV